MLTVFHLRNLELYARHGEAVRALLLASPHQSVFSGKSPESLERDLEELIANEGLILFAVAAGRPAGVLIAEVRKGNEFGVQEFLIGADAEPRTIDVLFDQCRRQLERRDFKAIYCNHDWYLSVKDEQIRGKFVINA